MRRAARTLGWAAAILLACALPTPSVAANFVPIQGAWTFTHPAPAPESATSLLVQGTFQGSSNLGPFTGQGTFHFDFTTGAYTGDIRWDFAWGSLTGTATGQDYPVPNFQGYLTTIRFTFAGGTGRFQGASGQATAGGIDNFNPTGTSRVDALFSGILSTR